MSLWMSTSSVRSLVAGFAAMLLRQLARDVSRGFQRRGRAPWSSSSLCAPLCVLQRRCEGRRRRCLPSLCGGLGGWSPTAGRVCLLPLAAVHRMVPEAQLAYVKSPTLASAAVGLVVPYPAGLSSVRGLVVDLLHVFGCFSWPFRLYQDQFRSSYLGDLDCSGSFATFMEDNAL